MLKQGRRYLSHTKSLGSKKTTLQNKFQLLNNSKTLAEISLLNHEVPVMIKQNCLMAIHTDADDANKLIISRDNLMYSWLKRIKFQQIKSSSFNRISISDQPNTQTQTDRFDYWKSPIRLIITNNNLNSGPRASGSTMYHLKLDGGFDWNVWGGQQSIIAYEENTSLDITSSRRILFDKLSKLHKFNILKGRGNVIINGQGSIIKIDLSKPYDKILINYKNLLAISGKSQIDINGSINSKLLNTTRNYKLYRWIPLPQLSMRASLQYLMVWYKNVYNAIIYYYNNWKFGYPNNFMEVSGPRSILLQTFDTVGDHSIINYDLTERVEKNEVTNINDNKSVKYWNARIYHNETGRIQFTPTDKHFAVNK